MNRYIMNEIKEAESIRLLVAARVVPLKLQ